MHQQNLQQVPHSQLHDSGSLAQQQQVTRHAPPSKTPHRQLAQSSHQSQSLEQPQQFHAESTLYNWTQSSSYQQPPRNAGRQLLYSSSQPSVAPVDVSGMRGSSINQHSLDTPDPQSQGYSTGNGFDISSKSPESNTIPAENPSELKGSMAPQNIGVSQTQHLDEALVHSLSMNYEDWLDDFVDVSQFMPP
ncbi:hypothetical protein FCOIX_10 [Fusarium coicis]|nr:hypothetical protein FCOIX_10 [Fusarium coicis]